MKNIPVKCLIFGFFKSPAGFKSSMELTPCRSSCIVDLNVCCAVVPPVVSALGLNATGVEDKCLRTTLDVVECTWRLSMAVDIVAVAAVWK